MSILFAAGEDEALTILAGSMSSAAGTFRSAYARGSIRATGAPGAQHLFTAALKDYLDAQASGPDATDSCWTRLSYARRFITLALW